MNLGHCERFRANQVDSKEGTLNLLPLDYCVDLYMHSYSNFVPIPSLLTPLVKLVILVLGEIGHIGKGPFLTRENFGI